MATGYSGVELRFIRGTIDLASLPEFSGAGLAETRAKFEDARIAVITPQVLELRRQGIRDPDVNRR